MVCFCPPQAYQTRRNQLFTHTHTHTLWIFVGTCRSAWFTNTKDNLCCLGERWCHGWRVESGRATRSSQTSLHFKEFLPCLLCAINGALDPHWYLNPSTYQCQSSSTHPLTSAHVPAAAVRFSCSLDKGEPA